MVCLGGNIVTYLTCCHTSKIHTYDNLSKPEQTDEKISRIIFRLTRCTNIISHIHNNKCMCAYIIFINHKNIIEIHSAYPFTNETRTTRLNIKRK